MIDAAEIAAQSMTPVIVLSDAFLANAVTEWTPPDVATLEAVAPEPHLAVSGVKSDDVFSRDEKTLARPWITPGMPELMYRIGGLEKDAATGNISYDPQNHQEMADLRAEKIARVRTTGTKPHSLDGHEEGNLLVVGWGSTYGPIRRAVSRLNTAGHKVGHLHIRQLWPLAADVGDILSRYRTVVCVELNSGQLTVILRSKYLVSVEPITKMTGRPFGVSALLSLFEAHLGDKAK
jgi:2-oxoglutarate ferredoxin oxidoreductase subunit alpha